MTRKLVFTFTEIITLLRNWSGSTRTSYFNGLFQHLAASRRHFGCRLPNHQLQTVAEACGYDLVNHHHALADAEACAVIAMQLL